MAVSITYDYNNAMAAVVGRRHGLTRAMLEKLRGKAGKAHEALQRLRGEQTIGFYDLADPAKMAADVAVCKRLGDEIAAEFDSFVILGIGGSALGPICVHRALAHSYYNLLDSEARGGRPRIFVLDNVDPELLAQVLDVLHPAKTCFNVITKSGRTSETIAQFMGFYDLVASDVGREQARRHFVLTTSAGNSEFYTNAAELGRERLVIPENVGGRFSELSVVGLLPAAVAGFNIRAIIRGAREVADRCNSADLFKNPAYLNGAIHYLADTQRGMTISVMMPYASALREFADWYCQLWAESLGKIRRDDGRRTHVGQTPVRALGTTDQHSQLQLYKEGPNNKIITFLGVGKFRNRFVTGRLLNDRLSTLKHLSGRDIAQLLRAEMEATEFSLRNAHRPSVRLTLGRIDEENIGGLLFFYMLQTAFTGELYGIKWYNQPGVEESKLATHAKMGSKTPKDPKITRKLRKMTAALREYERNRRVAKPISIGR